jgi:hypothetical protein
VFSAVPSAAAASAIWLKHALSSRRTIWFDRGLLAAWHLLPVIGIDLFWPFPVAFQIEYFLHKFAFFAAQSSSSLTLAVDAARNRQVLA